MSERSHGPLCDCPECCPEYYDDEGGYCDHTEYEVDFEGRAECICGKRWWLTPEEHERHVEWEREYEREMRRENLPWNRFWRWMSNLRARMTRTQDELPF